MITIYIKDQSNGLKAYPLTADNQALLQEALWIDLLFPSKSEEEMVEKYLSLNLPTRDEMQEIELSSRLYIEDKALFMTTSMLAQGESPQPQYDTVTFVLTEKRLITIRYIEPQAFRLFISKLPNLKLGEATCVLTGLLEATVERLADILESVGRRLEQYSKMIFRPEQTPSTELKLDYQQLLQQLGMNEDINTKIRESLISFSRMLVFFAQTTQLVIDKECQSRLDILSKDIMALKDHANFLSGKVNFLLDASLGFINIEQNKIIKIFSIAATIFLPPMLTASIYGMNFHDMPELSWHWGYPGAIVLMLLSAWLPYKYIKFRKWI